MQQLLVSKEDVLPEQKEWNQSLDQNNLELPNIKEEQEELWSEDEEKPQSSQLHQSVSVKSEDEEKPQSSQLHQSQRDDSTEVELLISNSAEHGTLKIEANGEDCGGSQLASSSGPCSHSQPDSDGPAKSSHTVPPKKVKKHTPKESQVAEKPGRDRRRSKKMIMQPSSPSSSASSSSQRSQSLSPSPPSAHPHAGSHDGRSQSRSPSPPSRGGSRGSSVGSIASTSSRQPKTSQNRIKKKRAKKTDCSLTVEQEEMMLEFLQENYVIWNRKMTDYRRTDKKAKLWDDQAALMGKTSAHLQGWFKSLRDTHTRLDKKKNEDGALNLTEREQWIMEKFGFLKSVMRHRHMPCNTVKDGPCTMDAHDLDAAEAACTEQQIGLDDDDIMHSHKVPKGKGKRMQDDDDALLAALQKRVIKSGDILKGLQASQTHQQPLTERTAFANYVRDSLMTMSKPKFKKVRSAMNRILSQMMEEESDDDDTN